MNARVAVVGAGPAGALLSFLLSSRGIDTLLIERQSDFSREFRGEVLMPSGVRALEEAGFDLARVSTRTPAEVQVFMNRRRFLTLRPSALAGGLPDSDPRAALPMAVSQPELLESLVGLAEATGHCDFRRGTAVRRIEVQPDGSRVLHVRHEDAEGDATETIRVPYLIGSDGRGSVCRRSLAPRVRVRGTPLDIVWFKIPYPEAWNEPIGRLEVGRGHLLISFPSPDGLLQLAWVIVKGTYGELKQRTALEWADEMSRYTDPELSAHLQEHRDALSRPFLLRAVTDRVRGWAAPGSLLIGDAAHTMSPVGAQGINIGLRDAIVAANELVPAFQKDAAIEEVNAAASRVEELRGPEVDRIQAFASLPPRIILGRTPFHEGVRRLIPYVAKWALARTGGGGGASAFLNGVTKVELRV